MAIWNWEQAPMVPPITPIGLVVLRKAVRLPIPPQATNPVGVIVFRGAAQPGYQTCFHIAPSYPSYLGKEEEAQPKARCVQADYLYTRLSGGRDRPRSGLRSWVKRDLALLIRSSRERMVGNRHPQRACVEPECAQGIIASNLQRNNGNP